MNKTERRPHQREERYRCTLCEDTTWIWVWGSEAIRAVARGEEKIPYDVRAASCRCTDRSDTKIHAGVVAYSEIEHPIFESFDDHESIRRWLDRRKAAEYQRAERTGGMSRGDVWDANERHESGAFNDGF